MLRAICLTAGILTAAQTFAAGAERVNLAALSTTVSAGSYDQGLRLGRRNGGIIVDRLKERTVDTHGCRTIPKLQEALVQVTRSIRPPAGSDDDLVRGFYRGYLDEVRRAIRDTRRGCSVGAYDSGDFVGALYGALLCQVSRIDIELAVSFDIETLFDGWSGGSDRVLGECRTAAHATLVSCGGDGGRDLAEQLSASVELSCSDRLVL